MDMVLITEKFSQLELTVSLFRFEVVKISLEDEMMCQTNDPIVSISPRAFEIRMR